MGFSDGAFFGGFGIGNRAPGFFGMGLLFDVIFGMASVGVSDPWAAGVWLSIRSSSCMPVNSAPV